MREARLFKRSALAVLLAMLPTYGNAQVADPDLSQSNQADITQIGESQRATIEQRNIHGGLLSGAIQQNGIGNNASMSLEGGNLSGSITQTGNDNQATLEVRDENNSGAIKQTGNGNAAGLLVDGSGQDVTLIQEGNGLSDGYSGAIRVGGDALPGGAITIRQR